MVLFGTTGSDEIVLLLESTASQQVASKEAPKKISKILNLLCNKLEAQKARGSKFIVGDALTAADIYLATMSYMFVVPSERILAKNQADKIT